MAAVCVLAALPLAALAGCTAAATLKPAAAVAPKSAEEAPVVVPATVTPSPGSPCSLTRTPRALPAQPPP